MKRPFVKCRWISVIEISSGFDTCKSSLDISDSRSFLNWDFIVIFKTGFWTFQRMRKFQPNLKFYSDFDLDLSGSFSLFSVVQILSLLHGGPDWYFTPKIPTGEMRPSSWQVHVVLPALPWRCSSQGRQCRHLYHQNQALHSVRWLVSNWLQGSTLLEKRDPFHS